MTWRTCCVACVNADVDGVRFLRKPTVASVILAKLTRTHRHSHTYYGTALLEYNAYDEHLCRDCVAS